MPASRAAFPDPATDVKPAAGKQTAVLAGGCFWCLEAVCKIVDGVEDVISGYSGDTKETAKYDIVSTGLTGHAEAVLITYDPGKTSYGQLLKIFFSVAHDPTTLDRQGPDVGPQDRSAIAARHRSSPYIVGASDPKVEKLRKMYTGCVRKR